MGNASAAPIFSIAKRPAAMLTAGACGERNHPFMKGNSGLPSSRPTVTIHGPARAAGARTPPLQYAIAPRHVAVAFRPAMNANGSAARAKIALEYLSAAAAPN